jgi:predicted HicB family RNase H-like nuclease
MVNVNIEIPEELHKKAKIKCAIEEITLKEFIIKAIEEKLRKR